jgi:hypothetical protein
MEDKRMPARILIPEKILLLKGERSYRELAEDIERKTGKPISYNTLCQLVLGKRLGGHPETIAHLAEYAGRPPSWFYEPLTDGVSEAKVEYLAPTGDDDEDGLRRQLLAGFVRDVQKLSRDLVPDDFEILADIAKKFARRRREEKKQLEKQD